LNIYIEYASGKFYIFKGAWDEVCDYPVEGRAYEVETTTIRDFEIGSRVYLIDVGWTEVAIAVGCDRCCYFKCTRSDIICSLVSRKDSESVKFQLLIKKKEEKDMAANKFSQLFNMDEESKKKGDEKIAERTLKRHLKEKYDSALTKVLQAETAISDIRNNVRTYDFNSVGEQRVCIRNLTEQMEDIRSEYKYFFGVDLPVEE
jgi:hypothetical protein